MHLRTWSVAIWALFGALASDSVFAEIPKFKDGDRICFIGDSITHQALYHTQIQLFYATRFPQMRLETWNCGFAGDTAEGGVRRYTWDIAPHKPTVATIMLGMNDVNRGLYAQDKFGPKVEAQRQEAIARRIANMDRLAKLLSEGGTRIVFLTPSLFDQTGNQKTERLAGVNDALKACADADRKLAVRYNAGLVDFNGPMEAINKAGQVKDPVFTIVGPDRVHPGPVGHLVMAYLFLKEQSLSPTVAAWEIDASRKSVLKQDNCLVSALSVTDGSVTFSCLEKALPFPVDAANEKALELVPFTKDLNKETLKVSGLSEGNYELLIDGQPVLKTSAAALKNGINLATVKETPQYKQAREVQTLLDERAHIEGRKLRTFAQANHLFFSNLKERTPEIERKVLEETFEKVGGADDIWSRYRRGVIESYRKLLPEKENLERQSAELRARIYMTNVPKAHSYELHRMR